MPMTDIAPRLVKCFQLVFPQLPESEAAAASQVSLKEWDSVAAITLVNVIEEEFQVQIDFDHLAELDSFDAIERHLGQLAGVQ